MATIMRLFGHRWRRFWTLLDSESVLLNQMLFYCLISLSGLYNLTATTPVQALQETMSYGYYAFFCWLCLLGPLATMIGKVCRGVWTYTGLWLCLAGDVATELIFWIYLSAVIATSWWGKGNFAGFIVVACVIGTNLFILRDLRQLARVEKVARIFRRLTEGGL